jgi:hypothetical protein
MDTHMTKTRFVLTAAVAAASLSTAQPATGQSLLIPATPGKGVWIEASHADFKGFDANLPSSVWYLGGRLPVTPRLRAVVDLPFSHAKLDAIEDGATSSTVFGNPYLGVEYVATERLLLELGTRAPLNTADEASFADVLALLADPQRAESFMEDVVPLSAAAGYVRPVSSAISVRTRGAVTAFFPIGENDSSTETAIDYGISGTYAAGAARLGLGVSGRWFATSDEGSFGENSLHHAGLSGDVVVRGVRPGIALRIPLDRDYRDVLGSSIGLYLQVPLR